MRRVLRDHGLALFFTAIFLGSLVLQSIVGLHAYNEDATLHGSETITYGRYLASSHFGQAVLENWQSEYLQFTLFILATIWLVQKGSPESKQEGGHESDRRQLVGPHARPDSPAWARLRGVRGFLYSYSLLLVMAAIFVASFVGQSVTGWTEHNELLLEHGAATLSWGSYFLSATFWEDTLQNWQSEFLAVGSMVVLTIYLRARGSPESKPVGAPHDETGTTG